MEEQRTEPAAPPTAEAAAPSESPLEAAIRAANAEVTEAPAPPETPQPAPDGDRPPRDPSEDDGPRPDDDEPNPAVPHLTRGQTRKLMEQWEAERKPRFFADLEHARAEADRLKAEAQKAEQDQRAATQGYESWYGPDEQYRAAEAVYDQIVHKLERGEYVPDQEINAARAYQTWRQNRQMAGTVHQRETSKVLQNIDGFFRQAAIEGIDVPAILAEVSQKKGHPGDVLRTVAEKVAAEWKGKLEAEKAAHAATRARLGLGRAPSAESGGRAPSRGDLVGQLAAGDMNAFIERAKRGDFADLDLSDR